MTDTMECLQIETWGGDLQPVQRPVPEPAAGEVRIEVEATSVGLTVRNVMNGDLGEEAANLPRIPGHEVIGRVAETGAGVSHPGKGDLVGAYFYLSCGHCDPCLRGQDSLCANLEGFVSVDTDGGLAEYVCLPAENALALPEGLDPVAATVVPDAVATPYHVANQRAEVSPGDDVLILGAGGGVGIHLVQMVTHFGGRPTAVDRRRDKLKRCRDVGAVETLDTTERSLTDLDREFDAVVDFVGAIELLAEATELLAPRGRIVNMTTFPGRSIEVSPREQVFAETEMVGSRYSSKYEYVRSGELVADGTIEPVVSEVVGFDGVQDLLDRIEAGELVGRGAMVPE